MPVGLFFHFFFFCCCFVLFLCGHLFVVELFLKCLLYTHFINFPFIFYFFTSVRLYYHFKLIIWCIKCKSCVPAVIAFSTNL